MKTLRLLALGTMLVVAGGCAGSSRSALKQEGDKGGALYSETARGGITPEGFADLTVTASIKTHRLRPSLVPDSHGSANYTLLVSIDGQPVAVPGEARLEKREAAAFADPEAGKGVRYLFAKTLRLQAGTHNVKVSLPQDSVGIAHDITLSSGSANLLVLEPVYAPVAGKQRPGFYGATSYKEGISRIRTALNGERL
ncbi:hypothetical protein [Geoanaerobacter pelophilus]|nr:hypothetical protein [Geoanaerobacter pelophilus]